MSAGRAPALRERANLLRRPGHQRCGCPSNPNVTTNNVTEWTVPTLAADIPDVYVVGTTFYFSERAGGKIGFLDPSQQPGTLKTAKQSTTPEMRIVSPASPMMTTLNHKTT